MLVKKQSVIGRWIAQYMPKSIEYNGKSCEYFNIRTSDDHIDVINKKGDIIVQIQCICTDKYIQRESIGISGHYVYNVREVIVNGITIGSDEDKLKYQIFDESSLISSHSSINQAYKELDKIKEEYPLWEDEGQHFSIYEYGEGDNIFVFSLLHKEYVAGSYK